MLMDELKKIGFSNIDDYLRIDDEGNVIGKDFGQMDSRKLAAIESIKQVINITSNKDGDREYETRNFQFKLHDKLGAIEKMGKHIGFYLEDNAQKGKSLVTIITAKPMSDEECENIREILKRNAD
jgi:F0F1-type ATP synthase delta subunit